MIRRRPTVAWVLALASLAWLSAAPARAVPGPDEITAAVVRLSDADAVARERAAALLWSAGKAAEPALRQALSSDDPETVRRARAILTRFELGLVPDTPPRVLELVEQYRDGDARARLVAVESLGNYGRRGLRVLVGLRRRERDEQIRGAILTAIGARPHEREGAALLLADGDAQGAGRVLKRAADEGEQGLRDWMAMLLVSGGIDQAVNEVAAAQDKNNNTPALSRLALFERAAGRLPEALAAARRAQEPQLIDSLLIEQGNWAELKTRFGDRAGNTSDTLGFTAAFCRLAGDAAGVESAAAALRAFADQHEEDYWNCAECLMLNDRVDEGIAVLLAHKNYLAAEDFLIPRMRYSETLALPASRAADLKPVDLLRVRARSITACRFTGDHAAAQKALAEIAAANSQLKDLPTWILLADSARQSSRSADAESYLAMAMALPESRNGEVVLSKVDLPEEFAAVFWWRLLRERNAGESTAATLARLRALAGGEMPAAEVTSLIGAARLAALDQKRPADRSRSLVALSQAMKSLGRVEESERVLRDAAALSPTASNLERVADCDGGHGNFEQAAVGYEAAWEIDRDRALPVAMRGWALLKAGDAAHGRALIDLAHMLPLGDLLQRAELEEAFGRLGLGDDARRERDIIRRIGPFLSPAVCGANRASGDEAYAGGDYLAAADYWQKAFLANLRSDTSFLNPWSNVMIPVMIHKARARGLARSDPASATREAKALLSDSPGDANGIIEIVLALDAAGHAQQANEVFDAASKPYVRACDEFPNSGPLENQLAWVEARCRRNLDDALKRASRAVELEPANTASIDTLAEVYFQRGHVDQAIERIKRCIELEPKVKRHREQLNRFSAAGADRK